MWRLKYAPLDAGRQQCLEDRAWHGEVAVHGPPVQAHGHRGSAPYVTLRIADDSINYTAQLSSQARKLAAEAARKAGVAGA